MCSWCRASFRGCRQQTTKRLSRHRAGCSDVQACQALSAVSSAHKATHRGAADKINMREAIPPQPYEDFEQFQTAYNLFACNAKSDAKGQTHDHYPDARGRECGADAEGQTQETVSDADARGQQNIGSVSSCRTDAKGQSYRSNFADVNAKEKKKMHVR